MNNGERLPSREKLVRIRLFLPAWLNDEVKIRCIKLGIQRNEYLADLIMADVATMANTQ